MTMFDIEYKITTREGMSLEADDREQAQQFAEEYIKDIYGPDEVVDFEVLSIEEENN